MTSESQELVARAMEYEPLRLPNGEILAMTEQDSPEALDLIMRTIGHLNDRIVGDVLFIGYYYRAIRDRQLWRHICNNWKVFCRDHTDWGSYEKVNLYINLYETFDGHNVSGITLRKLRDIHTAKPEPTAIEHWLDKARNDQEKTLAAELKGKTPPNECGHDELSEYSFRKCTTCGKFIKQDDVC